MLEQVGRAPVVLVEAPGGYGKSVFAAQLSAVRDVPHARVVLSDQSELWSSLGHALRRSGLTDLASTIDRDDPASFVVGLRAREVGVAITVDEVQLADAAEAAWLAGVAAEVPASSLVVLVGRRLGRTLARLAGEAHVGMVTAADLRFDRAETAEVLRATSATEPASNDVDAVWVLTDGWPAAVVLAGSRLDATTGLPSRAGAGSLTALVDRQLALCDAATVRLLRDLAHLPLISTEVTERTHGPGALDRLLDAGLPIRFRDDGWGEMSDPVRDQLTAGHQPDLAVIRAAAQVYARRGEAPTAGLLLARHGDEVGLVELLDTFTWQQLGDLGLPTVRLLLDGVSDAVLEPYAMVLVRAALAADDVEPQMRAEWLERANRLSLDAPTARAVAVERGRNLMRVDRLDEAVALVEPAIEAAASGEFLTRGRGYLALGLSRLMSEQGRASARSILDLETSATLFRMAGERTLEAVSLRASAFGAHYNLGAFEKAREQLDQAAALLAAPDKQRALFLTFVAEIDRDLGRFDEAESAVHESLEIGRRLANTQSIGFAAWTMALVAGDRRDREGLDRWRAEALAHSAPWIERAAAIEFYGAVAEALFQLGDRDAGYEQLLLAEAHPALATYLWPTRSARARYETMYGDPVAGERVLDELDATAPPRELSLRAVMRAVCAKRRGDDARAARELERAQQAARDLGDPERLHRREPELLAMLSVAPVEPTMTVSVRLLGEFSASSGSRDITPPAGRPATLVKLLALRGSMTADAAIDLLWPEADPDTGRARLRNLLNRVRSSSGPIIERDAELLRLAPGTEVDAVRFERAALRALDGDAATEVGAARAALSIHGGALLPGDQYADWVLPARERIHRRYLSLVDLVARDALERGNLDEAVGLLDIGIDAEPFEIWRYAMAARALVTQGRPRAAGELAQRALAMSDELGVTLDPELRDLLPI